jgi:outer membrane protein OmpA-like peptidoglycan-associated protein
LFDFNSYTLKPEAKTELDRIIEPIAKWPGATIIIEGHTDAVGSPEKNQVLSENRAAAVREFFKFTRLAGFKMTVAGYGESRPVATNDTDEGRAKNRRVEILVVPSSNPEVPR